MRIAVAILLALIAVDAAAQRYPGRDRGGSPRDMQPRESTQSPRSAMPTDPFSALEREMPSLKVDLQLKAGQVEAWRLFERDIRDLAEIGRQRTRYLLALRDPGDNPLPSAADVLTRLADEDRRRSDATAELKRHFDALYAMLEDTQKRMIDRRIVLSQTEPLGQETAPKR
jgi:hypothetical protein